MAKKVSITYKQLMNMKEDEFFSFVEAGGYAAVVADIVLRKTPQKVYPKVLKPMKKPTPAQVKKNPKLAEAYSPDKLTLQADKTATPKVVMKPITFFEVKCAFAEEVLKLAKTEPKKKETFRDKLVALANSGN